MRRVEITRPEGREPLGGTSSSPRFQIPVQQRLGLGGFLLSGCGTSPRFRVWLRQNPPVHQVLRRLEVPPDRLQGCAPNRRPRSRKPIGAHSTGSRRPARGPHKKPEYQSFLSYMCPTREGPQKVFPFSSARPSFTPPTVFSPKRTRQHALLH